MNPLCTSKEIWKNETNSELEGKGGASVSNSNPNWLVKLHFFDIALKNMVSARNWLLQSSFFFFSKAKKNKQTKTPRYLKLFCMYRSIHVSAIALCNRLMYALVMYQHFPGCCQNIFKLTLDALTPGSLPSAF